MLTAVANPFQYHAFNKLEYFSNIAATITTLFGLVYTDEENENLQTLWFLFIILINGIFQFFWLRKFFNLIYILHFQGVKNNIVIYSEKILKYLNFKLAPKSVKNIHFGESSRNKNDENEKKVFGEFIRKLKKLKI